MKQKQDVRITEERISFYPPTWMNFTNSSISVTTFRIKTKKIFPINKNKKKLPKWIFLIDGKKL